MSSATSESFLSSSLVVSVLAGRGLASKDSNGFSDPYVKVCLFFKNGKKDPNSRRKTSVKKKNLDPVWNIELPPLDILEDHSFIRFQCWDQDRMSTDDFMGEIRIPLDSLPHNESFTKWYTLGQMENAKKTERISGDLQITLFLRSSPIGASKEENDLVSALKYINKTFQKKLQPPDITTEISCTQSSDRKTTSGCLLCTDDSLFFFSEKSKKKTKQYLWSQISNLQFNDKTLTLHLGSNGKTIEFTNIPDQVDRIEIIKRTWEQQSSVTADAEPKKKNFLGSIRKSVKKNIRRSVEPEESNKRSDDVRKPVDLTDTSDDAINSETLLIESPTITNTPKIHFAIKPFQDQSNNYVSIKIYECLNLNISTDTALEIFVELRVKDIPFFTKIIPDSLSPVFNDEFSIKLEDKEITPLLLVWQKQQSKNNLIGEASISIDEALLKSYEILEFYKDLYIVKNISLSMINHSSERSASEYEDVSRLQISMVKSDSKLIIRLGDCILRYSDSLSSSQNEWFTLIEVYFGSKMFHTSINSFDFKSYVNQSTEFPIQDEETIQIEVWTEIHSTKHKVLVGHLAFTLADIENDFPTPDAYYWFNLSSTPRISMRESALSRLYSESTLLKDTIEEEKKKELQKELKTESPTPSIKLPESNQSKENDVSLRDRQSVPLPSPRTRSPSTPSIQRPNSRTLLLIISIIVLLASVILYFTL